ncbi:MAG: hypothetical protein ACRETW_09075 [Stenotrophobium sp.]
MAAPAPESPGARWALAAALLALAGSARAQGWPAALPLTPGAIPVPLTFYFPGGGPLARSTPHPDRWYATSWLPAMAGARYTVLLCCGPAVDGTHLYALDAPPPQLPRMKVLLNLSTVQLAVDANGRSSRGAVASFLLPVDVALSQLFLLTESAPRAAVDAAPTLSVEVYGGGYPMQRVRGGWWLSGSGLSHRRPQLLPVPVPTARPGPGW